MVRGGGICVAEPPGSPLDRVSPRIRALQDRLLDSLPADGAWECLSPAQREAIISLHRARITRNIDARGRSPERGKKNGNLGNKNFISKGLNKYGRCRSYEDKLESETDDSGVRLLSGETNSSSTSNSHSHEDDSSDPGVKREGRFTKSPRVDRVIRKEGKTPYDVGKRTNVPNGIGNVNKIISKQLNRVVVPQQPIACKATLDYRNIAGVKQRSRLTNNNFIFEPEVDQRVSPEFINKSRIGDQLTKSDQISRKNILERYRDPKPPQEGKSNRPPIEKYDNTAYLRNNNNRADFDFDSDQTPRSDRTSPSFVEDISFSRLQNRISRSRHNLNDNDNLIDAFLVEDGLFDRKDDSKDKDSGLDVSNGRANKAILNSRYDYRTHLNLDGFDKYSSNWNSIILNRSSDVPMRVVCHQGNAHDRHSSKVHPNPQLRQGPQANRFTNGCLESNHAPPSYPERNVGKKYIRSKSLDRKYLDDSSEDESDFEVRRRTERMRRYSKANQDWGVYKHSSNERRMPNYRNNMEDSSRPKAKSNIDLSIVNHSRESFDDIGDNCFQSRSNILNKWKSEDFDLSSKPHEDSEFDRSRWRRRSCDFELDMSDGEPKKKMKDVDYRRWQRRSCDFELECDDEDFIDRNHDRSQKWDVSMDNEMRIITERKKQNLKKELKQIYTPAFKKVIEPPVEKCHIHENGTPPPFKVPRKKYIKENEEINQSKVENSRIFSPNEDYKSYPRYPTPPGHPIGSKNMKSPAGIAIGKIPSGAPNGKNKTANAFRDNGLLSFENPNYTLNSGIIDDALNSNTNLSTGSLSSTSKTFTDTQLDGGLAALDSLYTELDHVCNLTRASSVRNRRHYADLCHGSMGVDVNTGPVTNLDKADHQNNSLVENECMMGRKKGNFSTQPDLIENTPQRNKPQPPQNINQQQPLLVNNQDSTQHAKDPDKAMVTPDEESDEISSSSITRLKNGVESSPAHQSIPHMTPYDSQDLYALPIKKSLVIDPTAQLDEKTDPPTEDILPCGWEKHEDNDGPYYWHIKSGTITRDPPTSETEVETHHVPLRVEKRYKEDQMTSSMTGSVTRSNTSSALSELVETRPRTNAVDNAYKRRSYPARSDFSDSGGGRPIRFAVRSLGWVEIAEEDLTPERSSKAVNRCIVDLSMGGRRDVLDVVGCWGDGKDLFMDLDEGSLKLVDPENLTVLNTQPIHTIRVWGVGRDNGRDFAYVARDRMTRKHMCHVFRCDTPARTIANTLRDICKKIMIERSLQQTMLSKTQDPGQNGGTSGIRVARPTNLPTEHRRLQRHSQIIPSQSFPTPMEEPKKVVRAQYVGSIQVTKPSGIEVLNAAIQTVIDSNPMPWKPVAVSVAPSTITITSMDDDVQLAECRVRFLSFLGIGQNVKECAFIMHTAQDQFIAHVFHCEPSSGALCKIIEAACKLRYQKCLDAHPGGTDRGRGETTPKSLTATLKSVFTTFAGRKARSAES